MWEVYYGMEPYSNDSQLKQDNKDKDKSQKLGIHKIYLKVLSILHVMKKRLKKCI